MTKVPKPYILRVNDGLMSMPELRSSPIRTVLVDARTLIREGFRAILERCPHMCIVGSASCLEEAVKLIHHERPDIILFSSDSSPQLGLDVIPQLIAASPQARLVLIAGSTNTDLYEQAVVFGASGVVHQTQTVDLLVKAIEKVHHGEVWLDRTMVATLLGKMSNRSQTKESNPDAEKITRLGERERQVIALAGKGLRNKEIGDLLSISEVTVRHYFTTIFSKLEVSDRLELIIFAYRHRLAHPPE